MLGVAATLLDAVPVLDWLTDGLTDPDTETLALARTVDETDGETLPLTVMVALVLTVAAAEGDNDADIVGEGGVAHGDCVIDAVAVAVAVIAYGQIESTLTRAPAYCALLSLLNWSVIGPPSVALTSTGKDGLLPYRFMITGLLAVMLPSNT